MDIAGEYRIPAARERVWAALNDPEVLRACIPGCRSLEKVSDTEFASTVAAKVGPVSATFRGNVVLSELDPPRGYTISGQGQGGAAGFARMSAKVTLDEDNGETLLRYEARADVGGKLASVGSRLVQGVARKNADDFFSAFARALGGGAEAAAAPAPEGVTARCAGRGAGAGDARGHRSRGEAPPPSEWRRPARCRRGSSPWCPPSAASCSASSSAAGSAGAIASQHGRSSAARRHRRASRRPDAITWRQRTGTAPAHPALENPMSDIVIAGALRTAIGKFGGALAKDPCPRARGHGHPRAAREERRQARGRFRSHHGPGADRGQRPEPGAPGVDPRGPAACDTRDDHQQGLRLGI